MGRNQGVYRRSQSQLPPTQLGMGGKQGRRLLPHRERPKFVPSQHLPGAGVLQPLPARERTTVVELTRRRGEPGAEELREPAVASGREPTGPDPSASPPPPAAVRGSDPVLAIAYLVTCALALWCYALLLPGDQALWRKVAALVLLPVLVWAGTRVRPFGRGAASEQADPAPVGVRVSLVSLAALALLLVAGV